MSLFKGAFTAMITPMLPDGAVDYDGFRENVKFQLEQGIDGLLPLGTTAETPTLDEDEEVDLIKIAVEEAKAFEKTSGRKIPVVIGAGSNNTRDAVRYVERAKNMGADAALVVAPYYNKPSQEGIFKHYEAVSKVGIPIIVYNIKGRSGVNINTDTLEKISELPNIIGVKEASGDINQIMEVIAKIKNKKNDFAVFSGDDSLTLSVVACGGDGVISVVSNLAPKLIAEFTNTALKGDFENARKLHYRLLPFFKAAFVDGNPTSIKYAMNYKGMKAGAVRLPLVEVKESAKKIIEAAIKESAL